MVSTQNRHTYNYNETLDLHQRFVGRSCKLHFQSSPLKVVRGSKQYLYDDIGQEYLDCVNNVAHVGHCHPHVVGSGQDQMAILAASSGFLTDNQAIYAKKLVETLPSHLCVTYFVNSGSEANDLALMLARSYTKHKDVICVENAFHGNVTSLLHISPLRFHNFNSKKKKGYVHVAPVPDMYRGMYKEGTENAAEKYAYEVKKIIQKAHAKNRQIAAFICDPLMTSSGIFVPPQNYLKKVYNYVHEAGGLVIANEVQVGLGRVGTHYWAFQAQDVIPDIVTIGRPLGNGHPMAAVVTTKEIADSIEVFESSYGGNPVSCSIGSAVLDVIKNEKLLSCANNVGRCLMEGLKSQMKSHQNIGQVRGMGMVIGIDIVTDQQSRKASKEIAELLVYRMRQKKILVSNKGPMKNIIILTPPLCFTCENARTFIQAFDQSLTSIENAASSPNLLDTRVNSGSIPASVLEGLQTSLSNQVINNYSSTMNGESIFDSDDDDDDGPISKRPRYEDLD